MNAQEKLQAISKEANNVLYFNDGSDYSSALWKILEIAKPELFKETDMPDLLFME